MAVRTFEYTVTENSINPSSIVQGGIQGEHNATELKFNISSSLKTILVGMKKTGRTFYYRFDCFNGAGMMKSTVPKSFDPSSITAFSHLIEEWQTRYGGTIQVYLVITLTESGGTNTELYSYGVKMLLRSLPGSGGVQKDNYESITTLYEATRNEAQEAINAAEDASMAAKEALIAHEKTEQARAALLESNAEWIFDGGDASGTIDIELVVDNAMSDSSENPVQNKVVKRYIDAQRPIGSVYIASDKNTNPANLFGGTWELFDKEFHRGRIYISTVEDMAQYITPSKANVSSLCIDYFGHSITISAISKFNSVLVADDPAELFTFNEAMIGISLTQKTDGTYENVIYPRYTAAIGDMGNSLSFVRVAVPDSSSGKIVAEYQDKIPQVAPAVGDNVDFTVTLDILPKNMLDDFCDKFYWKRTA